MEVRPGEIVYGHIFRAWLKGNAWIRPDGVEYSAADVDSAAWIKRVHTSAQALFHAHQQMLEAVEEAIPASEARAAARDRLDAANTAREEFARAFAEREDGRPLSRQRIRKAA